MPFEDRADAARQLAEALRGFAEGSAPLVLAIPRGGVPIGSVVAQALGADLDIVLVRKIGAPGNPEFAIGAVDEAGRTWWDPRAALAGTDSAYADRACATQLGVLRQRRNQYTPGRQSASAAGRVTIVLDDGVATGSSMIAALLSVRQQGPARLICATPVAAPDALRALRKYADDVVCLETPRDFGAVSQYYRRFPQVEDREVIDSLHGFWGRRGPRHAL